MNKTYWSNETPNEGEPQMLQVPFVSKEVQEFLSILHSLLIGGRYGYVRAGLLMGLYAELQSDLEKNGTINLDSLMEAIDTLLRLSRQELEEASWLAYLTGRQVAVGDDLPLEERAKLLVEVLGLKELMEFNLSLDEEETDTEE